MIIGTSVRNDTDTGIGTMFSEKMGFSVVGLYRIEYELLLDNFISGIFYLNFGIYKEEELGRKLVYDRVERALKLEITGNNAWYTGPYGYIRIKSNNSSRIERFQTDFSKTQDFYMN